jgi:N-acetylglucosaminyldiphosphoundecaprenol N-acetyl-beta-D-mannosaminyltransferase
VSRQQILRAPLDIRTVATAAVDVISLVRDKRPTFVCIADTHSVVTAKLNEDYRQALNSAALVVSDGMLLVWLMKLKGVSKAARVTGTDLMHEICKRDHDHSLRHYFFGSTLETCGKVAQTLKDKYGISIAGIESPPFRPLSTKEDDGVKRRIEESGANVVWVCLGCPKQERWMYQNFSSLNAVLIGVGAAFDFISGGKKRAPVWMQKSGLEWLHRLCSEPRRLTTRYIMTFVHFIPAALLELTSHWMRTIER